MSKEEGGKRDNELNQFSIRLSKRQKEMLHDLMADSGSLTEVEEIRHIITTAWKELEKEKRERGFDVTKKP